jgi:hypothetical protein
MPIPRILLISRKSLEHAEEAIKEQISAYGVQMAVALSPEDAEQAKKLTEAVAQFQHVTAIVADFPIDMAINDDGSLEVIGTITATPQEPSLITEV